LFLQTKTHNVLSLLDRNFVFNAWGQKSQSFDTNNRCEKNPKLKSVYCRYSQRFWTNGSSHRVTKV